jgi:hypothetical protein
MTPALLCAGGIAALAYSDTRLQNMLRWVFEVASVIFAAAFVMIILYLAWQWMRAGLFLLFKIDLRMKKSNTNDKEE